MPLQRIRPALELLKREFGLEYVLASRRLMTDGSEVLWDLSAGEYGVTDLVVARNNQHVFVPVVQDYLQQITWGGDDYPVSLALPIYRPAIVTIDPTRGFGRPIFESSRARSSRSCPCSPRGSRSTWSPRSSACPAPM